MNTVKDKIWFLREGLFAKYVLALVGLVVFVLAVNGALETWISYRGIKSSLTQAMSEKAQTTATHIEHAMSDLEGQSRFTDQRVFVDPSRGGCRRTHAQADGRR